ncbi:MAG: sodium:proton antiporter, partial [Synergistaceae bacterium]|nr:sodium:proton antiporter [Synergistaceae bacterium]
MLIANPVVISVVVMCVLCLINLNIVMSLLIAAMVGGLAAGISVSGTMSILIGGMGGNAETALSYFLLGTFAVAINKTGLASVACKRIAKVVKTHKIVLMFILAAIGTLAETIVPVHIAFIPILVPPLLYLFNELSVDRRQAACALAFGLKAPYIALPIGFGLVFHGILSAEMAKNGMEIAKEAVYSYTWILGAGMLVGFLLAIFAAYNKPRRYENLPVAGAGAAEASDEFTAAHFKTLIAVIVAFGAQLWTNSLPIGALSALLVMIASGALKWKDIDGSFTGGLEIMGLIAFVMLIASGYGNVLRETKSVEHLVAAVADMVGGSAVGGAFVMLAVGLLVTMGIGTSFGTIPIIAAIY